MNVRTERQTERQTDRPTARTSHLCGARSGSPQLNTEVLNEMCCLHSILLQHKQHTLYEA